MATLGEVKARVRRYLIDVSADTEIELESFINDAIRQAEEQHNWRHMEKVATFTTVAGQRLLGALPTDWKESRFDPFVKRADGTTRRIGWLEGDEQAIVQFDDDPTDAGEARKILEKATTAELEVYPYPDGRADHPDGEYRVHILYWGFSAALIEDSASNWWTMHAGEFLTYQATMNGQVFNENDAGAAKYAQLAQNRIRVLRATDKHSRLPQRIVLAPRPDVHGATDQPWRGGEWPWV